MLSIKELSESGGGTILEQIDDIPESDLKMKKHKTVPRPASPDKMNH